MLEHEKKDAPGGYRNLDTNEIQEQSADTISKPNDSIAAIDPKSINKCFVVAWVFSISLGFFQFGFAIASWNTILGVFTVRYDWDTDQSTLWASLLTTFTNLGAMLAALFAGNLIPHGKWNLIMITNILIVIGSGLCLVDNIYVISVGRFIWGMAAGAFSVFCPKFVNEAAPTEMKGSMGAMSQLMCTAGIFLPALLGLPIPNDPENYADEFIVTSYWRVVWGMPLIFVVLQVFLLLTVFRYDTPVAMKQKGDYDKLTSLLGNVYGKDQVQARMNQINVPKTDSAESIVHQPTMKETFFEPTIRRSAWVGVGLSFFQQASGINAIIFYSSTIFSAAGVPANIGNVYVMGVNFLATGGAVFLLTKFGRRTLMLWTYLLMGIILCIMGISAQKVYKLGDAAEDTPWSNIELIFTVLFVAFFEFGPGPITWLYMSEIMNNQGVSAGTVLNWTMTLIVGIITPSMFKWFNGYTFVIFAVFVAFAYVFTLFFMKETKGLSDAEVARLYRTDNDELEAFTKSETKDGEMEKE